MKAVIDIILIIIIALCTWNGYKRGLVGGVAGILAIIVSLLGASIVSAAYAHEVVPAIEPFVDGYLDSHRNRDAILERMGYGSSELSLEDILEQDSSLRYDYAYESLLDLGLKSLWRYRDLWYMYIRRDIVTFYKQTVLGPLWFLIQPVLTTAMYMFVFGGLAGISTDGAPQPLFYLSGVMLWNYFSDSFNVSSNVFINNLNKRKHLFNNYFNMFFFYHYTL